MKDVLVIHGGESYDTYEDYLEDLRSQEVYLDRLGTKGWKSFLQEWVGEDVRVIAPKMPCKQNAKYKEWKIWFEKYLPFLNKDVVLIGHSMGGIFLVKYLAENQLPVRVSSLVLVAAPFEGHEYSLADFALSEDLSGCVEQAGEIMIYHSSDDFVVPVEDAHSYAKTLDGSKLIELSGRGHFNDATFPELEQYLREITARS